MQFDSRPVIVYGITVANRDVAKLVKKVLIVSFLSAVFVVTMTILNFTVLNDRSSIAQTIISCLIGISIPLIGWVGAKTSNQTMVGAFCAISFSCSIFNTVTYILIMVSIRAVILILEVCGTSSSDPNDQEICNDYTISQMNNMYIVATVVAVPAIILQCLGGFFGNQLYTQLTPDVIITYAADPAPGIYEIRPQIIPANEVVTISSPKEGVVPTK